MAISRLGCALCLVVTFVLLSGDASAQGWGWTVNPAGPYAGDTMKVDVWSAPCSTITVEFWVDGIYQYSVDIQIFGTATWTVPANYSGRKWEVRVVCHGSSDNTGGTFG